MTLIAWKSPVVTDTDEAQRLVALEDDRVFAPSADVARFYAELIERSRRPGRSRRRGTTRAEG